MTTWSIPQTTTGNERRLLESMLDRNRAELINTACGLSEEDARACLVDSMTTPIGLLKHAATAERIWFHHLLGGLSRQECEGGVTGGDPSFIVADDESLDEVITEFETASRLSRTIAAKFDLDETRMHPHIGEVNLRFIYLLAVEDFARHAGHGDILREQLQQHARRSERPSHLPLSRTGDE